MACWGGVGTSVDGVVVGEMMRLVPWYSFTDALVTNVLLPEHTQDASLVAHVFEP